MFGGRCGGGSLGVGYGREEVGLFADVPVDESIVDDVEAVEHGCVLGGSGCEQLRVEGLSV